MDKRKNPNNTDTHKQCADCKRVLLRSEFPVAASKHDGLFNYCKECMAERNAKLYQKRRGAVSDRRRELKAECVNKLGGKCSRCGYHEFVSGLDFHHLGDKDDGVAELITKAATGNGKQHALLMAEIAKCILLCRNCHSSYHAGEWP